MMLRTNRRSNWLLPGVVILLALGHGTVPAHGQLIEHDQKHGHKVLAGITYPFEITGRSPEPPIMKYRLQPLHAELTTGNGAQLYYRALLLMSQADVNLDRNRDDGGHTWEQIEQWRNVPLDEFPVQEAEELLRSYEDSLQEASYGARRSYCDWELPTREHGTDLLGVLLPEIQKMRSLARLLALRIRLRMIQGRFDEAIYDLQTGYAMARHVGNKDFLVNALIGIAIGNMMDEQLLNAISYESTPNLYWSIVNLPSPLIDITNSMSVEQDTFKVVFPELLEAANSTAGEEYWDQKLLEVINRSRILVFQAQIGGRYKPTDWEVWTQRAAIYSQVPRVKRELVEKMGYDAGKIDAMCGSQAILLYSLNDLQRTRDQILAPFGLPYYQAKRFYDAEPKLSSSLTQGDPLTLSEALLPSLPTVHKVATRDACWRAMLQATEAIRDYAQKHGQLPESLEQVTDLPIPMNPFTNQPLIYTRDADNPMKATLKENNSTLPQRFEMTLRQP